MTGILVPLVTALSLSAGELAGLAFLAILVFGILAVLSLSRHIRRSRRPWSSDQPGGSAASRATGEADAERDTSRAE